MSPLKVMVVDDDEGLCECVCGHLHDDGYEAVSADNGSSALGRLRTEPRKPDLILLDLTMPCMDGWEFREEQLQDPSLASIPVVVMTASRDTQGISADEVLYKPLKRAKLLDVVRRRSGHDAANDTEERFRMLADNMSQLAWTCDLLGNVTWYNKRWLDYTGLAFEDMKGWNWSKVQHPDHVDRVVARVRHSGETGEPWEDTFPLRGRDGQYRWFLSRAVPIRDEHGKIVQWFGTNTDVTEQKLAEEEVARQAQELRGLNERLKELDRLKSEFFSNISHEFRTPLTLMLGPTEDILRGAHGELGSAMRAQLELLHRSELRLQKLVHALLDFSRVETGRIHSLCEPLDIAKLTQDLASTFRAAVEAGNLTLTVDCPPLQEPIYVNREMWEKIVLHLLSNALKFTFEGGIDVSLRLVDDAVELSVKDTGIGIPEEEMPQLFERFHRVRGARARTHEGSGVGLALVQELAKLHSGSVRAESRVGHGTTFTVTIPRGSAHLPADRIARGRTAALDVAPFVEEALQWVRAPAHRPSKMRPKRTARILVAEDNADMRDYVQRLLESHWHVEAVEDGEKALASAKARPPDLVLTDVMMPGLDGFELLRELRRDETTRSIPVVMLSARAGEEARVEGLESGAEDYLVKPFSARELLARVRRHLELAKLRNEVRAQRENLYALFMQAPSPICVFQGENLVFEVANDLYLEICGRADIIGKPLLEAFPELEGQGLDELLRNVMQTGETFVGKEMHLELDRNHDGVVEDTYWTFTYAPLTSPDGVDRVMAFCNDVTEQREAADAAAHLAAIVMSSEDAIISKNLHGTIQTWNQAAERLFGYSAKEMIGQSVTRLIPKDRRNEEPGILGRIARGDSVDHYETVRQRKDGSLIDIALTVSPIRDGEGRIIGASKIARDISERTRTEDAMRQSEARFRTIFETSEVSIWEEDLSALLERVEVLKAAHGADLQAFLEENPSVVEAAIGLVKLRNINPATLRMFGAESKSELLGSLSSIFLPETRTVFLEELLALAQGKRLFSSEAALRTLAGKRIEVLVTVSFPPDDAKAERVLVTLVDISARKNAEVERDARVAEMERAVRFSDMFAGILAHDLRNPLSAISMGANVLSRIAETEQIAKPVSHILRSADRMERMIFQLLDFTHVRLGRGLPLERSPVDLLVLCQTAVSEIETATGRDIELHGVGDATGSWDRDRLAQLVSNLVANACHHGVSGPIQVVVDGTGESAVRLVVANQGLIPADLLPVIFEPLRFRDAGDDMRPKRKSSGLGLGLYITQQIVLAHGGEIGVESDEPSGTTRFTVLLPRDAPRHSDHVFDSWTAP